MYETRCLEAVSSLQNIEHTMRTLSLLMSVLGRTRQGESPVARLRKDENQRTEGWPLETIAPNSVWAAFVVVMWSCIAFQTLTSR